MAVEFISEYLQNSALIINESTSYPGTLRNYIMPKIQKKTAINFLFASAPERIDPGNKVWDLKKTPRVVAGITSEAQKQVLDFYQKICNHVVEVESVEVAEASKIFENTFRQVNIALVNEFSILCNKLGFSATASINAAATKPFGFIPFYPSIGVGGHCIPIDPVYLTHAAKSFQIQTPLIDNANQLNLSMPKIIVECIRSYLGVPLSGIKIQLIGLTYKSGVSDVRESPAIALLKLLQEEGADVFWYDENLKDYNKNRAEGIMPTIDLGILINYFPNLDLSIWEKNQVKVLNFSIGNNSYNWPKFF
jgi:UDP-N-acetyl-D-glucosamine dehydrogenase